MQNFLGLLTKTFQLDKNERFTPPLNALNRLQISFNISIIKYNIEFLYPYLLQEPNFTSLLTACSDAVHTAERNRLVEMIHNTFGRLGGNSRLIVDNVCSLPMKTQPKV